MFSETLSTNNTFTTMLDEFPLSPSTESTVSSLPKSAEQTSASIAAAAAAPPVASSLQSKTGSRT